MGEHFFEMDITAAQADVIARAMLAVARAENGIHPKEFDLVLVFYGRVTGRDGSSLFELLQQPDIEPAAVSAGIASGALARLFVQSCLQLAYADGEYGPKERERIELYAGALKMPPERLLALEEAVKERMAARSE